VLLRPRSGDGSCLVTDADVRAQSVLVSTKLIFENMKQFESKYAADMGTTAARHDQRLGARDRVTARTRRSAFANGRERAQ
jgi:hypothetical protein